MGKYNALLIGCGNIGALYDYERDDIWSHAKAYALNTEFKLSVYDIDSSLANKIATKYNANIVSDILAVDFGNYDCISICTPTHTHYSFLKKALLANTKVIICEKPISYTLSEISDLELIYKKSASKVIVNYIRRFQPAYMDLRLKIAEILEKNSGTLLSIVIKYQKGFINNSSHALDIIEFLMEKNIILDKVQKSNVVFDYFENDPTISLQALWNNASLTMIGLTDVKYPVFEIELFFSTDRISITESGQKITIFSSETGSHSLSLALKETCIENCLRDYMVSVIDLANKYLTSQHTEDNFLRSVYLNKKMLEIVQN